MKDQSDIPGSKFFFRAIFLDQWKIEENFPNNLDVNMIFLG